MNYISFKKLKQKLYFTITDVQNTLKINHLSARVLCSRYVKKGIFIRIKNNFYVFEENWNNLSLEDLLKISNFLQVPSYISFMTALSYYEITTQVQRDFFENASLKRSIKFNTQGKIFNFYKLQKQFYFDFTKQNGIFIATKEKAFVDAVYLYSFGKYKLDFNSLNLNKLDKKCIKKIIKLYPKKTKNIIKKICKI